MKAALLIGVSEYKNPADNLPGCEEDLSAMYKLLQATGEYSEILPLSGSKTPAVELKNRISEWIEERRKEKIDELFFYYTGHGLYVYENNEFYFQLYDFEPAKRNQTSLTNSDLDIWLRSLSPELTVKVIDACNSGVHYIKGGETSITKYLSESGKRFQKCVFMFSSTTTQNSYQSNNISDFTRAFIDAVGKYDGEVIRYRNIIDYISDEFENNGRADIQRPIFVTQAHNTEIFSRINTQIQRQATERQHLEEQKAEKQEATPMTLKQRAEEASKQYASKEEALIMLAELKQNLESYGYSQEIIDLYNVKSKFVSATNVPLNKHIAQWLADNSHNYYAEPIFRTVYDHPLDEMYASNAIRYGGRTGSIGRKEVQNFKFTVEVPFEACQVIANRKYISVPLYYCVLTYLISKANLTFYYFYTSYREKNWDENVLDTNTTWRSIDCNFDNKKKVIDTGIEIISGFEAFILEKVKAILDKK